MKNFQKSFLRIEDCFKILGKICFCSAKLTFHCFKLGINDYIEKFFHLFQNSIGAKGK